MKLILKEWIVLTSIFRQIVKFLLNILLVNYGCKTVKLKGHHIIP